MTRVLLYGDTSLNIIDGSSIWLTSVTEMLSPLFDEVHVLLKMSVSNSRLLNAIACRDNVTVHPTSDDGQIRGTRDDALTPVTAAERLRRLTERVDPSMVLVRGLDACVAAAAHPLLAKRLYAYITDLPFPFNRLSPNTISRVRRVASASQRMFAQTESARSYLEVIAPEAAGKTLLLPPQVPDYFFSELDAPSGELRPHPHASAPVGSLECPLRMTYAGKLAKDWRTLEMLELPRALAEYGVSAELTVLGDKFQRDKSDRTWHIRMRSALLAAVAEPDSGVTWKGGLPRHLVSQALSTAHIGLGWRSPALDSSLELSSKVLEFGASHVAPLINRTSDHEALYSSSYPLFVDSDDLAHAAARIAAGLEHLDTARDIARAASERHRMSSIRSTLQTQLARSHVLRSDSSLKSSHNTLIATHDPKFLGEILNDLDAREGERLEVDRWETLHTHDEETSKDLLKNASTVFCEWAGPNLAWYSHRVSPQQTLVTRLHAFELRGKWWDDVNTARVDTWVFVSEHVRRQAVEQLGLDSAHTLVIPNSVDCTDFNRPKMRDAQFHLGMAGIVTFNKRPDRALDLLHQLIEVDDRYTLHIKGRMPWEYSYEWKKPAQRLAYEAFFDRIRNDESLQSHVVFDPFSPDISNWFRSIGIVLSPSVSESFHMAAAEGMASGSVPLVWDRQGAVDIFGDSFIVTSLNEALERVLTLRDASKFASASQAARQYALRWDVPDITREWSRVLVA